MIGAEHQFHDEDYAEEWARRFEHSLERQKLFSDTLNLISDREPVTILELGIGPGYLAEYILQNRSSCEYHAVDFSQAMIQLAKGRLGELSKRVEFHQLDLINDDWWAGFGRKFDYILSTWSLHDLGSANRIKQTYEGCTKILDGRLINGDFIKPVECKLEFEPGRIPIDEHIQMMKQAGLQNVLHHHTYESNPEAPSPSNNYALLTGDFHL